MIQRSQRNSTARRGFVSTFVVLAVMVSLAVIGMLCMKAMMAHRRHVEQTMVDAQLELMVVATVQWVKNGGELPVEGTFRLLLSEEDAMDVCEVELTSQENLLQGKATIRNGGTLKGTKKFSIGSVEVH